MRGPDKASRYVMAAVAGSEMISSCVARLLYRLQFIRWRLHVKAKHSVALLGQMIMAAAILPGCASLSTGGNQSIAVKTEPPGATCDLHRDGDLIAHVERTPGAATVAKSGHDIAVNCALQGRMPGAAVIPANMAGATFGNVIFGGFLGYGIDLASGAASEYPRGVRIWMDPETATLRDTPLQGASYSRPMM
jgi:hypothetical protein